MARCRLVRPETVRVELSDGDSLELKRELNAGEYRDMIAAQFKETQAGEGLGVDLHNVGINKILAYLVGWSLVNFDGVSPLPVTRDSVDKLDHGTYVEILNAIEAHHDRWELSVGERKNDQAGAITSAPISPSAA
jgi:hypothetical protein